MMQKKMIKPLNGTELTFRILKKRIETGVSLKNKSGKTYKLIEDIDTTKESFIKLVETLPNRPGILIITGHSKNSFETLEIIKTDENLRSAFFRSKKNRLGIMYSYINIKSFDYVSIQLAKAS